MSEWYNCGNKFITEPLITPQIYKCGYQVTRPCNLWNIVRATIELRESNIVRNLWDSLLREFQCEESVASVNFLYNTSLNSKFKIVGESNFWSLSKFIIIAQSPSPTKCFKVLRRHWQNNNTADNYKLKTIRPTSMVSGLLVSCLQLEKIQDARNIWAGIVVPSVPRQKQFRAAAILPPLISGSNQNDSRDFVRRFGPLGAHQLRVMQLRLNANELTLDRKWLYAPLAANSKAITVPFFRSPLSYFLSSSRFPRHREYFFTRRPKSHSFSFLSLCRLFVIYFTTRGVMWIIVEQGAGWNIIKEMLRS